MAAGADLVAFPELAICGYPPEDLVYKKQFVKDNRSALEELATCVEGVGTPNAMNRVGEPCPALGIAGCMPAKKIGRGIRGMLRGQPVQFGGGDPGGRISVSTPRPSCPYQRVR